MTVAGASDPAPRPSVLLGAITALPLQSTSLSAGRLSGEDPDAGALLFQRVVEGSQHK